MNVWFDELDLDPSSTWRRMGTRSLGDRPWLVVDDRRDRDLELKADLLRERPGDVLISPGACSDAARDVRGLVEAEGVEVASAITDDLEATARVVQEDLCLLRRRDDAWHLDAACVCFPSRWRLRDKIGRPLDDVHRPIPGYAERLDRRVTSLLDRLTERPVLRRNWFVHPDPSLFQPEAPARDEFRPADEVAQGLHIRSERQTLRRLPTGWILFTIRTQHDPLGVVLAEPVRRHRFLRYLRAAPSEELAHRGMGPAQVEAILAWDDAAGNGVAGHESDTTSDS